MKKKIVVATTVSADGTIRSGGTNVMNGFYKNLAAYFEISLVFLAPYGAKNGRVEICPGLTEITISKSKETEDKIQTLAKETHSTSLYDVGMLYFTEYTPLYEATLRNEVKNSLVVIVDRPYLYYIVKKVANGRPIIQRSTNIEYFLRKSTMTARGKAYQLLQTLFQTEKKCSQECEMVFSCSDMDMRTMVNLYHVEQSKIAFIPNGIDLSENPFVSLDERLRKKQRYGLSRDTIAVFIGGGHQPNVEACELIVKMACFCTNVFFVIAGGVCGAVSKMKRGENVVLLGNISEKTRRHIFSVADLALNPMFSGSGANVKMIDYMSIGIPIISTRFGTRGIVDTSNIKIADNIEAFIREIKTFSLTDMRKSIEKNREIVERYYDWNVVAKDASSYINRILE